MSVHEKNTFGASIHHVMNAEVTFPSCSCKVVPTLLSCSINTINVLQDARGLCHIIISRVILRALAEMNVLLETTVSDIHGDIIAVIFVSFQLVNNR